MGQRGPKPGTGGRPKKPLADKITEGNPGKRKLTVLSSLPELEGMDMPEPKAYLSDEQRNGVEMIATEIYESMWKWLKDRNCEQFVSPELIEHYALTDARHIQCERLISQTGYLAKHPTTGAAMTSPYISISLSYLKQSTTYLSMIEQIVRANCSEEYSPFPKDDLMERLLKRGG
jgi:hypothetical protein